MSTPNYRTLRELIDSIREDELTQRVPPPLKEPIECDPKVLGRKRRSPFHVKLDTDEE